MDGRKRVREGGEGRRDGLSRKFNTLIIAGGFLDGALMHKRTKNIEENNYTWK